MSKHYDLIAIGGGSGGLAVAERAAQFGKRVAIVDAAPLGGTCVNAGCVPKKVMWYAAHAATAVREAANFGVQAQLLGADWQQLVRRRDEYTAGINAYWERHAAALDIDRLHGSARFRSQGEIEVEGARYSADHLVVATGSRPRVPPVPGAELGITSDQFFGLQQRPERVAIIGGGYIGVELAGVLRALGSEVTVVAQEESLLATFDPMLSQELRDQMAADGIQFHLPWRVARLERGSRNLDVLSAEGARLRGFDAVIWAVGRSANVDNLDLGAAGLSVGPSGHLEVDDWQHTAVPGIYAVGDVTGRKPLTPTAIAAGRRLAERLFGNDRNARVDYDNVASVVFAHPPVGTIGLSEPQAVARYGDQVSVYETRFTPMSHAFADQPSRRTAMKLVCAGAHQQVVGLHVIGESADELLQGFAVAVTMGATKADIDRTIAVHPTSAEELVTLKQGRPGRTEAARQAA